MRFLFDKNYLYEDIMKIVNDCQDSYTNSYMSIMLKFNLRDGEVLTQGFSDLELNLYTMMFELTDISFNFNSYVVIITFTEV